MTESAKPTLVVLKDGVPLPEDEARPLWTEFSEYMEATRGDFAGFAKNHGWHSVASEYRRGQAVLVVSTTAEAAAKVAPPPAQKAPPKPAQKAQPKGKAQAKKGGGAAKQGKPAGKGPAPKKR